MAKSVTGMLLVVAAVLVVPLISYSAGLGKLTVRSALGQPLDAEIEVVSLRPGEDDSFQVRLATREAFGEAGIDFSPALASARFTVERRDGIPVIRLTTTQPMNDPFLSVLVEMHWPTGRLARQYTFLVDPIEYKTSALAAAPTSATAPASTSAPAPAQPVAAVPAAAPAPAPSAQPAASASAAVLAPAQPVVAAPVAAPAPAPVVAAPAQVAAPAPVQPVAIAPAAAPAPVQPVASAPGTAPALSQPVAVAPAAAPAPVQPVATAPAAAPAQPVQATPAAGPAQRTSAVPAQALVAQRADPARLDAETYRIKRGDTLGAIARKWKPEGVTLNQMLIALYQGNPDVFIRDNINLIRAGAKLSIPYREEVAAVEPSKASRQVRLQMSEFARYRRQQGTAVSAAPVRPVQREVVSGRAGGKKAARSL